jgi:hypothetical protein
VLPLAAAVVLGVAACDEQLDAGLACPAFCPVQERTISDTTMFAVEVDTSIAGYPTFGAEGELFIASLGDTLDTRGVIRYDSLPNTFRHANSAEDSTIYAVDSAFIRLRLSTNDTLTAPVTVEAYDVDLGGPDNDDPTLAATAFTADRLLGTRTFAANELKDSIAVPIDNNKLLAKTQLAPPDNRLRVGIRVAPTGRARLSFFTSNAQGSPLLEFRPSTDTTVRKYSLVARSKFPTDPAQETIASDLADYLLVVKAPPEPPADVLRVGGAPGHRVYFRFNIPSRILDSTSIVRATLQLTQRPAPFSPDRDSLTNVRQYAVTVGPEVTEIRRALLFLTSSTSDSVLMTPVDSGVRNFEMIGLVRAWRNTSPTRTPRAFALRSASEGHDARQADFFSNEAPVEVRPRLHLFYLAKQPQGIP